MHFYLRRLDEVLAAAAHGMTVEGLFRRPGEGKWCAAEILEHLSLTYAGTARVLDRILQAGRPETRPRTLMDTVRTTVVLGLFHMPSGRQAPTPVVPRGLPGPDIVDSTRQNLALMDEVITRCEQTFGGRLRVANHPVLGPLTANQWRKFHWVHGRHHVRQIEQLRRHKK
jgi:hypothetical protein